ncbi:MAG: glycosyltransferase, partial [Pseudomonadota bacterium]
MRRIGSFRALGHAVASLGLQKHAAAPDWEHVSLGRIAEERLGRRLLVILAALPRLWAERRRVAASDLIVARNLDMAVLALVARIFAGQRVPVVYECLDIHGLMTGRGWKSRLARWVERRVLARVALLVLSSPGFQARYFGPVQGYHGPWHLLENKLVGAVPARQARQDTGRVIGWVGALRCAPSFALLCAVADALPEWRVELHGRVHEHALPGFDAALEARPNMEFCGPYAYPEGLGAAYARLDLVWAQDLWQGGANSDWLLPNRIYEASWCGCPSIAVAGTETGRRVAEDGLGFVVDRAEPGALIALLEGMTPARIAAARAALLARPEEAFRQAPDDLET